MVRGGKLVRQDDPCREEAEPLRVLGVYPVARAEADELAVNDRPGTPGHAVVPTYSSTAVKPSGCRTANAARISARRAIWRRMKKSECESETRTETPART